MSHEEKKVKLFNRLGFTQTQATLLHYVLEATRAQLELERATLAAMSQVLDQTRAELAVEKDQAAMLRFLRDDYAVNSSDSSLEFLKLENSTGAAFEKIVRDAMQARGVTP